MESSSQATVRFSQPNRTLVIMAKAPKPGMVKTRLTKSLPSPAVAALYRCLLEDTLALATSLASVEVAVMCPESDQDELAQLLGNTVQVVAQKGRRSRSRAHLCFSTFHCCRPTTRHRIQ